MLDFAKLLHDAFGANWPKTFILLMAIVGAVVFGGIALALVKASQNALAREGSSVATGTQPPGPLPTAGAPPASTSTVQVEPPKPSRDGTVAKKQEQKIGTGPRPAIEQRNSGGINVQQTTAGDNSPIINSPVTVNQGAPPQVFSDIQKEGLTRAVVRIPPEVRIEIEAPQDLDAQRYAEQLRLICGLPTTQFPWLFVDCPTGRFQKVFGYWCEMMTPLHCRQHKHCGAI